MMKPSLGISKSSIRQMLEPYIDTKYRQFRCGLMPGFDPVRVLGVRVPQLRRISNQLFALSSKTLPLYSKELDVNDPIEFLEVALLALEKIQDQSTLFDALDQLLPYLDNWWSCDLIDPKSFYTHREWLPPLIDRCLQDQNPYIVRFAIVLLIRHFTAVEYQHRYSIRLLEVSGFHEYVDKAIAWYFSTAMVYHFEEIFALLFSPCCSSPIRRASIQKACESYRISREQKLRLRDKNNIYKSSKNRKR